MILFGNLMLGIAALVYSVLIFSLYSRPAPGGDASVGHAYAIIYGNLFLLACFAAATLAIGAVRNVLTSVEKFEGMGVDFRPAMQTLRDALNGPPEAKEATANCKKALDKWLGNH